MQDKHYSILFVYNHLRTGGIETLIVRMANWLVNNGHNVTLFLLEPGECLSLLDKRVKVIIYNSILSIYIPGAGKRFLNNKMPTCFDLIYSYGPEACFLASFIYKYLKPYNQKPVFLNGIYHPYEFAINKKKSNSDKIRIQLYNDYINDRSKLFMSEEVRSGNTPILGREMPGSEIWPLPINDKKCKDNRKFIPYKIISIGRYDKFKKYNIYMIRIIEELVEMGYDATWEAYGYGPLEHEMKKLVDSKNLLSRISINGRIPYEKFAEVASTAQVFIGMGTSIIEAGFCKVPCIPAIVDDTQGLTYGPLYNLPYYSCGEPLADSYTKVSVKDEICRIFNMSSDEYNEESEKTYRYVQAYAMNPLMENFLGFIDNKAVIQKIDMYPGWKFILYLFVTTSEKIRTRFAFRTRMKKIISHSDS